MRIPFRIRFAFFPGFLPFFAAMTPPVKADVIYTCTGNDFNSFSGSPPLNSSDFITCYSLITEFNLPQLCREHRDSSFSATAPAGRISSHARLR